MLKVFSAARQKLASTKVSAAAAKRCLLDDGSCALALLEAAQALTDHYHAWEPESLWIDLAGKGIDVPLPNRAKIQAALSLIYVPSFYWDGIVFEKTALAFDGHVPNPEILEEATAAQLAWAVEEAEQILSRYDATARSFEYEPKAYAAVVLAREGFVLAPKQLKFAQARLDTTNHNDRDFREDIERRWAALEHMDLKEHQFSESREGVQLARLAAVELHVKEKEKRAASDINELTA